ncbi:MAG: hypothetical protein V7L04_31715 [Nostoc sp.]|uniref:hypothetical protein n=1 Tax=Nostoc sp. TaxID=1180 RepID=UPI002FFC2B89
MIIEVLQLLDLENKPIEQWQLTVRTDEHANPHGLCTHVHDSYKSAWNCLEAWSLAKKLVEGNKSHGDSL